MPEGQTAGRGDPKAERILSAAKSAFLEFGYAETSMDLVAQRAHASKTTLYKRFPSKEALFSACMKAECKSRGAHFSAAALADQPVDVALRDIGMRLLDLLWSPEVFRLEQIVTGEAARFPEVASLFYQAGPEHVSAEIERYFEAARQAGKLAIANPRFAAEHFVASLRGARYCGLMFDQTKEERAAFVAQTVAMFLDGARPRA